MRRPGAADDDRPRPFDDSGEFGEREPAAKVDATPRDAGLSHMSAIIDALASPIAIFGPNRDLVQANRAYCELWDLDANWLRPGMDERPTRSVRTPPLAK